MTDRISATHEDWTVEFAPAIGGAVSRLTWRGRDILRPMPATSRAVLDAGCFPMVPFANRIAGARFMFRDQEVVLPIMPDFAPNTLHGHGWLKPWTVVETSEAAVELAFAHDAGDWPWSYESRQSAVFVDGGVRFSLSLTNTGDRDMPGGIGLHPYFPIDGSTRLTLHAASVWALAEKDIPTTLAPVGEVFDWSGGPPLSEAPALDHCYAGWGGVARLTDQDRTTTLRASANAGWAHVFTPEGTGYCCIEPVTHRPDAVNAPKSERSGLAVLAPGETLSMWMEIGVE